MKPHAIRNEIQSLSNQALDFIQNYCFTDHPTRGVLRFPPFPYLHRLITAMDTHPRLLVLKSRQVCATWAAASWVLYRSLFHWKSEILLLSKEHRSAMELLQRIRNLAWRLPLWFNLKVHATKNQLTFPNSGSRILTLPATAEAIRFFAPTIVLWDEMAFTENADEIWSAISPSLDRQAQFIGISTPNGKHNLFGKMVTDPKRFGFALQRIHFSERPDRGEEWQTLQKRELSEAQWRREYELSLEEVHGQRVIEAFSPQQHVLPYPVSIEMVHTARRRFRSIDFGYRSPVVLWIAEITPSQFVVFEEWIGSNATRDDLLLAIRMMDGKWLLTEQQFTWSSCDPAGLQQNDSGIPMIDFLSGAGIKLMQRRSLLEDGLDWLRMMFARADGTIQLRISPQCSRLINDLSSYRYDEHTGKPIKGSYDHTVDALRYFAVNIQQKPPTHYQGRVSGIKW
ncbi:MAG: hypothetical protein N2450_01065 [bacterium]|nr:hypothetical protein [bacterium]